MSIETIVVIVILLLALLFLVRSWGASLRRAASGESACSSCSGSCASKTQGGPPQGSPLGDLRQRP